MRSLSYTLLVLCFSAEFLLHSSCYVFVRSFSYIPHDSYSDEIYTPGASFSEVIFLHTSLLVLVRSFSYTPDATFGEEFFLHS